MSRVRMGVISRLSMVDRDRLITILSLLLALSSLFYAAWRDRETEFNETIRAACFDVLRELGTLQTQLHYAFYEKKVNDDPIGGWGRVLLIADLSTVIPAPAPDNAERLREVWSKNWETVAQDEKSLKAVLGSINEMRNSVLKSLKSLN